MAQGSNPWGAAEGAGRQAFWVRLADIIKHEDLVLPLSGRSNRSTGDTSGPADIEPLLKVVVAEAQRATVASGAAIALLDGSEFFCRAASGTTAPVVGSRLDGRSGLSGQCIRSGMPVRCDETEFDPRANAAACRELGIRSVLAVPVLSAGAAVGVLEVFSPKPAANHPSRPWDRLGEMAAGQGSSIQELFGLVRLTRHELQGLVLPEAAGP